MALFTLIRAGEILGLDPRALRAQIKRGKLTARKIDRTWLVEGTEIERYRREDHRVR